MYTTKDVLLNYPDIDIFTAKPYYNPEKKNYKGIKASWTTLPKITAADYIPGSNYYHRPSLIYPDIDFDCFKLLKPGQQTTVLSWFKPTFSYGRNGFGHYVYKINNPKDWQHKIDLTIGGRRLLELRGNKSCYNAMEAILEENVYANIKYLGITKLDYEQLWNDFFCAAVPIAMYLMCPSNHEVINNFLLSVVGELGSKKVKKDKTVLIVERFLTLLDREDREKESLSLVYSAYKSEKFSNIFSKNYDVGLTKQEKEDFRKIIDYWVGEEQESSIPDLKLHSGEDIFNMPDVETNWLLKDYIPEGITVLASRPKVGKSWLALQIALAAENDGIMFGKKISNTKTAYFAYEDGPKRIKKRFVAKGITSNHIKPSFVWESKKLGEGLETQIERLIKSGTKVIIIDTFQKIYKEVKNNNSYVAESQMLNKLHRIALDLGAFIIIVHHTTKAKYDDVFDEISGTTALQGVADTLWILSGVRNSKKKFTLHMTGRDIDTYDKEVVLNYDYSWEMTGEAGGSNVSIAQREIIKAIENKADYVTKVGGLTPKEILDECMENVWDQEFLKTIPEENLKKKIASFKREISRAGELGIIEKSKRRPKAWYKLPF